MKIVINGDYGGFGLSEESIDRYIELAGLKLYKHKEAEWNSTSYYTVPYEEFLKVNAADHEQGEYTNSNALCWTHYDIARNDSFLVQVVEELKEKVNSVYSSLKVVNIPDDIEWQIEEYDGWEHVAEKHKTWR